MKLAKFYQEAQERALSLGNRLKLSSVILDDWRGGERPRLIYGAPFVKRCRNQCETCPLFQSVGEDPPDVKERHIPVYSNSVITTLVRANRDDIKTFPFRHRYLNCKTVEQYAVCYAAWLVKRCFTPKETREELGLVRDFRIVFSARMVALSRQELEMRRLVVRFCLRQPISAEKRAIILRFARQGGWLEEK